MNEKYNLCAKLLNEKKNESKIAIIYNDNSYSYRDLYKTINKYATYLKNKSIMENSEILICSANQLINMYLFLSSIKLGIHPILLNNGLDKETIHYICNDSNAKIIFVDSCIVVASEKINHIEIVDINRIEIPIDSYEEHVECLKKDDIPIFSLYTSGSSGKVKRIYHTYYDVIFCTQKYSEEVLHVVEKDVFFCQSKIPFAYGLISSLILPLLYNATTILNSNDNILELNEVFAKNKITVFFAVPVIYKSLIDLNMIDDNFKSVRMFVSAGELLPELISSKWNNKMGKGIVQGYGSSELLYIAISNNLDCIKSGSIGKVLNGYKAEIHDVETDEVLSYGNIGELYLTGDSLCEYNKDNLIYYENEIWWKTGDLVQIDKQGYFWFKGRINDNFKVNGCWVDSVKISHIIEENENVSGSVVAGELSNNDITRIVAYIVEKKMLSKNDLLDIKENIAKKLGRDAIPKAYYIIQEFPKGVTGKISRKELNDVKKIRILK